jgi:hypothetical protein
MNSLVWAKQEHRRDRKGAEVFRVEPEARERLAGGEARLGEREPPDGRVTHIPESGERPGRAREGDELARSVALD